MIRTAAGAALATLALAAAPAFGQTAGDFTDWTSVSANVASGTLHGVRVSLSGSHVWNPPVSELGDQSDFFSDPASFTPPLDHSDHIQISGYDDYSYTLSFSSPVTDPVLHIASLASTLQFPAGTQIARVSGSPGFTVSGTTVTGDLNNNAGGTIRLAGSIGSVSFGASTLYQPPVEDGVVMQVGAPAPPPPPPPSTTPAPGTTAPAVTALAPAGALGRGGMIRVLTARLAGEVSALEWYLRGDRTPTLVSAPRQTSLRLRLRPGPNTISVRPIGPDGAPGPLVSQTINGVVAAPTGSAGRIGRIVAKLPSVDAVGSEAGLQGSSSPGCSVKTTVHSGALDIAGCLTPITSLGDIPAAERGIVLRLAATLNIGSDAAALQTAIDLTDAYRADGPVKVDGLTLTPGTGASVVLYPQIHAIASSNAGLSAGFLRLAARRDFVIDTRPVDNVIRLGTFPIAAGPLSNIGGFPLVGDVDVSLISVKGLRGVRPPAEARLTTNVELPAFLSRAGVRLRSAITLRSTAADGLQLDRLTIGPLDADLGALAMRQVRLDYTRAGAEWRGQGEACVLGGACLDMVPPNGGIVIRNGHLSFAGASLGFPPPGIPLFPGLSLERIGFGFGLDPTRFVGNARITAVKVLAIDGRLVVAFPTATTPYVLDRGEVGGGFPAHLYSRRLTTPTVGITADAFLKVPVIGDIKLGNGYFLYEYPGYVALGGGTSQSFAGVVSFSGAVGGEFNAANGRFRLGGSIRACIADVVCGTATGVVSSRGLGACVGVGPLNIGGGVIYSPFEVKLWPLDGCRWSRFDQRDIRARAAQADGVQLVRIAPGDPSRAIELQGNAAAPRVRVTAPDGTTLESPVGPGYADRGALRIIRSEQLGRTVVGLQDPKPGTYRIEPSPGSAVVTRLSEASDPPSARVTASVRGTGTQRLLTYVVRRRHAQRVTFSEITPRGTEHMLGSVAGGGRGRLRFTSAPGNDPRRIEAQFELNGLPAERLTVARFSPAPPRLARPGAVQVRRRGGSLRVRWEGVSGARTYEVVATPSDGPQVVVITRSRHATIRGIRRWSRTRVTVRGVAPLRKGSTASMPVRPSAPRPSRLTALPRCRVGTKLTCRTGASHR